MGKVYCNIDRRELTIFFSEEMMTQLLKVNAKAIITSISVASTALAAKRACLSHETPFIVIDDKIGSMPEGSIPFSVSIKIDFRRINR